jgi:phosphocarrier protein
MVSEKVTIINKQGLHARPAGVFVKEMANFQSNITIINGEKKVNAKRVMQLMTACIKCGTEIEIQCEGPDEAEMLQAAIDLIKSGMGDEI